MQEAEPECSSSVGPTTATTRQQQQDNRGEGSAMSGAVMAAIVGGLLVALLLSGVLVAAMVVFIRLRKKHSKCKHVNAHTMCGLFVHAQQIVHRLTVVDAKLGAVRILSLCTI